MMKLQTKKWNAQCPVSKCRIFNRYLDLHAFLVGMLDDNDDDVGDGDNVADGDDNATATAAAGMSVETLLYICHLGPVSHSFS